MATEQLQGESNAEQARHNRATEVLQQYQIATAYETALIAASAQRYAADTAASASRYAADTQRRIATSNQANNLRVQQMKNSSELLQQTRSNAFNAAQKAADRALDKQIADDKNKTQLIGAGLSSLTSLTRDFAKTAGQIYSVGAGSTMR